MTELILRINNSLEFDQLLPILTQLKISYRVLPEKIAKKNLVMKDAVIAQIKAGVFDIPDLDAFIRDFEQSRQDRPLFGRNH